MKKCEKCNLTYSDDMNFCLNCGGKLSDVVENHRKQYNIEVLKKCIPFVAVALVLVVVLITSISDNAGLKRSKKEVQDYRIQQILSEPSKYDLQINTFTVDHSLSYTTINGSVTNTSTSKKISYYKIKAKYYSNGEMADSDWTNGTDLSPGETKSFSIMTKGYWLKDDIVLSVEEVS